MRPHQASRTAEWNAAFRAAESARGPDRRLLHDPYASRLLPVGLRALARTSALPVMGRGLNWYVDRRWPGLRSSLIARTRLIDDWLVASARNGAQQLVMLGAGFDSRAWRLSLPDGLRIFEVDHPDTSKAKQTRLARTAADLARVRFVEVDFDRERLSMRLVAAGFDPLLRTIVIWDGVTNYLQADAVAEIVEWAGSLATRSEFIFTYVHAGVLDGTAPFYGASSILRAVARSGEPWTFGLRPGVVAGYVAQFGMRLTADLNAAEYRLKVMGPAADRMRGYEFYHVARAEIAGGATRG